MISRVLAYLFPQPKPEDFPAESISAIVAYAKCDDPYLDATPIKKKAVEAYRRLRSDFPDRHNDPLIIFMREVDHPVPDLAFRRVFRDRVLKDYVGY